MPESRDRFDGLRCQVPGCKTVIRALTGLQELVKLRAHMRRAHLARKTLNDALETRAEWEGRDAEHEITERTTPISVLLRCRCGWSREITRKQNALARAAKVRAARAEHEREAAGGL